MIVAMSRDELPRWTLEQRAWRLTPPEMRRVRADDHRVREVRFVRRDGLRWVPLGELTVAELESLARGRSSS